MTAFVVVNVSQLNSENSRFNLFGFQGTATAGTTTEILASLPQERWIEGAELVLYNQDAADRVTFQIVAAADNPFSLPEGTLLGEYGSDMCVAAGTARQGQQSVSYMALTYPWMVFKIIYTSAGSTDVVVGANLRTHIPMDVA